jgi:ribosomal protein L11 methylase PrmA
MVIDFVLLLFLGLVILMCITAIIHLISGVPYVPTPMPAVRKMIEMAKLKKGDKVFDLGCGDGRLLFEAEKITQTAGVGFEIAPLPFILSQISKFRRHAQSEIKMSNLFSADLSEADVIFCYLMPHFLEKLKPKFENECKKGTLIVSHAFQISDWPLKEKFKKDPQKKLPNIYIYEI